MPVRIHAEWLTQTDERILEVLDEAGPLTKSELHTVLSNLAPVLDVPRHEFDQRCAKLHRRGLLVRNDNLVALSTTGMEFLDGEYHLSTFEDGSAGSRPTRGTRSDYWICSSCGTTLTVDDDHCPVCNDSSKPVQ
ncbi:hypothetical protein [Halobacterium yunchengense]|uniref:hypothetical protein n=1 Tax=Halobacterium yunchengense TaxID=3108497 RepID=UPI003009C1AA